MDESPQMTVSAPQQFAVTDEMLIARLRAGEQAAGDELVKRYVEPLLAYLQRLTRSPATAEDMHQHTWLSVLEHLHRFDEKRAPGGFKAWLFRIATNKVNDLWRSRARQRKVQDGLRLLGEEEAPDALVPMLELENQQSLQEAINLLPEPQRQVVLMRYYGDMKFAQIAEALGCPLNTALGRMHKALLKLRRAMDPGSASEDKP